MKTEIEYLQELKGSEEIMNKEQMNKYSYELMVKNNSDEAIKNLLLKDKEIERLQKRINKSIELLEKYGLVDENGNFNTYLDTIDLKELYEILKGSDK